MKDQERVSKCSEEEGYTTEPKRIVSRARCSHTCEDKEGISAVIATVHHSHTYLIGWAGKVGLSGLSLKRKGSTLKRRRKEDLHTRILKESPHMREEIGPHCFYIRPATISQGRARLDRDKVLFISEGVY